MCTLAGLAGLATGCSTGIGGSPTTVGTGPTTTGPAQSLAVGIEHNGGSVTLGRGELLTVALDSTYWELSVAPSPGPLSVVSNTVEPGGPGCASAVVGSGCGTARLVLRAQSGGTATVSGHRSSCGEALRCQPGQDAYELRVVVSG